MQCNRAIIASLCFILLDWINDGIVKDTVQ